MPFLNLNSILNKNLKEMNSPKFEVYLSVDNNYRWRLKAGNGEIIATSEGYITKYGAITSANNVKLLAPIATIVQI
jgi:uncharacterized protein YegP (UPF0339 family)